MGVRLGAGASITRSREQRSNQQRRRKRLEGNPGQKLCQWNKTKQEDGHIARLLTCKLDTPGCSSKEF